MKQKKDLEKVSEELQRTRLQLASLIAQQEARNSAPPLPVNRFIQMAKDVEKAPGAGLKRTPKSVKVIWA